MPAEDTRMNTDERRSLPIAEKLRIVEFPSLASRTKVHFFAEGKSRYFPNSPCSLLATAPRSSVTVKK